MKTLMKIMCIAALVLMTGCESEEARQMRQFNNIMNGLIELAAWDAVNSGYSDTGYSNTSSESSYSSSSGYGTGSDVISSYRYEIYPAANDMGMNFNVTSW